MRGPIFQSRWLWVPACAGTTVWTSGFAVANDIDSQRGFATLFTPSGRAARTSPACRFYPPSLPGIARRKTRVNALMTRQSILFAKILTKKMDPRVKPAGDDRLEGRVEITTGGLRRRAAPMLGFALAGLGSGPKSVLRAGETRQEVWHLRLHQRAPRDAAADLRGSARLAAGRRGRRLLRLSPPRASREPVLCGALAPRVSWPPRTP